jgi:hypothetical protein
MNEKEKRITPTGKAKWAHLVTPKQTVIDGKSVGDPKYQIDVVFDPKDPEWVKWLEDLTGKLKVLPVQIDKRTGEPLKKRNPIKRELDSTDEPTGKYYITFRTSDKFKPPIFDTYGREIKASVGNGSKVKVAYTENTYVAFGGGISLYLNAVQVIELVEFVPRSAQFYGFDVEPLPEEELLVSSDSELNPF